MEPTPVEIVEEPIERKVNHRSVVVTEVSSDDLKFYVQFVENGTHSVSLFSANLCSY